MVTQCLMPLLRVEGAPPSLLINVGSLAGLVSPYLSMYGACKAFNNALSRNLSDELARDNILVCSSSFFVPVLSVRVFACALSLVRCLYS